MNDLPPNHVNSRLVRVAQRNLPPLSLAIAIVLAILLVAFFLPSKGCGCSDAREAYIASELQTIRGQIELYKIQHHDVPPDSSRLWVQLLNPSNPAGQTTTGNTFLSYPLGPYLGEITANPANSQTAVASSPSTTVGWVYQVRGSNYTLKAVNTTGNGVLPY